MTDNELLQAISTMIDQKLEPIKAEIVGMKAEMVTKQDLIETEQSLKTYVDERLHESENMILNEVDRVQEKTNEKFNNLKFRVM